MRSPTWEQIPRAPAADETWLAVNPGWEGYGGIIRPAWVELRPAAYIENLRLGYKLAPDYTSAACRATVFVSSNAARTGEVSVTLSRGGQVLARATQPVNAWPEDRR